jgi:hypothetical protein
MLVWGLAVELSFRGGDAATDASFAVAPTATATDAGLAAFARF